MKHFTLRLVMGLGITLLGTSSLFAYDAHHPDPMSFLMGNSHRSHRKPKPIPKENNVTKIQKWRMYKQRKEAKYIIKPEPYSIASKKSDPELLGPQRTYQSTGVPIKTASIPTPLPKAPSVKMTHDTCVSMIGQAKFDQYVEKYGGERGALRRCFVLKRIRDN
jgi:hypothetical protein